MFDFNVQLFPETSKVFKKKYLYINKKTIISKTFETKILLKSLINTTARMVRLKSVDSVSIVFSPVSLSITTAARIYYKTKDFGNPNQAA